MNSIFKNSYENIQVSISSCVNFGKLLFSRIFSFFIYIFTIVGMEFFKIILYYLFNDCRSVLYLFLFLLLFVFLCYLFLFHVSDPFPQRFSKFVSLFKEPMFGLAVLKFPISLISALTFIASFLLFSLVFLSCLFSNFLS